MSLRTSTGSASAERVGSPAGDTHVVAVVAVFGLALGGPILALAILSHTKLCIPAQCALREVVCGKPNRLEKQVPIIVQILVTRWSFLTATKPVLPA